MNHKYRRSSPHLVRIPRTFGDKLSADKHDY